MPTGSWVLTCEAGGTAKPSGRYHMACRVQFPPELGNLANMDYLELGLNNLTGPIPPELGNLASPDGTVSLGKQSDGPDPAGTDHT